ncbi:hypothetical protein ASPTUDRAFT_46603 [Aspergillus tubingensis CBS 134.48]|uniref:Uncharacterized protein n=1 Tax=Aspergillus tubingensis (strain CBS 134.48) TaxID=767770 RepID=A0A1L9MW73_ASPTC|nr:hypothetical protein ASPTUDRAFT_46603 [Aspergillus tubingensis CBS 134.48]
MQNLKWLREYCLDVPIPDIYTLGSSTGRSEGIEFVQIGRFPVKPTSLRMNTELRAS